MWDFGSIAALIASGVTLLGGGSILGLRYARRNSLAATQLAEAQVEEARQAVRKAEAEANEKIIGNYEKLIETLGGELKRSADERQNERDTLRAEFEAKLKAQRDELTAVIETLRERVRELEKKEGDCAKHLEALRNALGPAAPATKKVRRAS